MAFSRAEQADLVERSLRPAHRLAMRQAGDLQGQQHVIERIAVEQQFLVLEDQAEVTAHVGQGAAAQGGQVLAIDHQAAGGRPLDGRDQLDQRRLAGTGMAGDQHHLAAVDTEAGILDGLQAARIALGQIAGFDHELAGSYEMLGARGEKLYSSLDPGQFVPIRTGHRRSPWPRTDAGRRSARRRR